MIFPISVFQIVIFSCFLFCIASSVRNRVHDCVISVALAIIIICFVGVAQFWIAFFLYPLSLLFKALIWTGCGAMFVHSLKKENFRHEFLAPILVFASASIILALWTHLGTDLSKPLEVAQSRWTHLLPIDNALPFIFAEHLRNGAVPTPMIGEWLSSDRPPLQTGLYLLLGSPIGLDALNYQIISISMQMLSLIGVWILTRALGASPKFSLLAMVTTFFTPFILVNGSFVWPKLISGGLLCITAAFHFTPLHDRTRGNWLLGAATGLSAALALLGHGATSFTLVAMALTALVLRRFGRPNYFFAGALAFGLVYAPWAAYQKYYDPPGNHLTKWHLLGVTDIDSRTFGETAKDQLASTSMWTWIDGRVQNFDRLFLDTRQVLYKTMIATESIAIGDIDGGRKILAEVRVSQFFFVESGLGVIGLFMSLSPFGLLLNNIRPIVVLFMISISVWILLMFTPGSTVIHQGSMLPQLLLISGTIATVSPLGFWPIVGITTAHIVMTIFQYVL
jgi:hypothetical protein